MHRDSLLEWNTQYGGAIILFICVHVHLILASCGIIVHSPLNDRRVLRADACISSINILRMGWPGW